MSDTHTPSEDPFADLFSRLPASRARAMRGDSEAGRSTSDAPPVPAEDATEVAARSAESHAEAHAEADAASPDGEGAGANQEALARPTSRRAAREAAAAAATGTLPAVAASTPTPAPESPSIPDAAPAADADADDVDAPMPAASSPASAVSAASGPLSPEPVAAAQPAAAPTLDALFSASTTEDAVPTAPRRRRRGGWIAFGIIVVLLGAGVAGGAWVWNTYEDKIRQIMGWEEPRDYEAGQATGEAMVTIAQGDVPSTISKSLFEAGVTKTSSVFYDMLIKSDENPTFYPGVYKLQKQMTASAALAALQDPANKLENSALVREGLTVATTLPILAESLGIPVEDFQAAVKNPKDYGVKADSLEGWLFPAMYTFDPGATAKDVIATMVARTVTSLDAAEVPEADRERVLTTASIIQREARFEDDFFKVSRVIQNRLDQGMRLQMDSTAQYGYGELHEGSASTSAEAQYDENPWNTYVIDGLPIGPISNPGDLAIKAAMTPAEGPWLFFVTVNLDTGETVFTTNLDDHNKAVRQWQQWCSEHPDSGC